MKTFAMIGAAGYVAPRHMAAIKSVGGDLVAALDPHDSVGILDSYFPNAAFFTEFERFDRHLEKLKRRGEKVDYIVVCSPNYLHDAHCRYGLRYGANVICEKPLVLNPWNLEGLMELEKESEGKVYTILQLRLHESAIKLKKMIDEGDPDKIYDVELKYITPRGKWYHYSWKGDVEKSGGIATNIGIHFFDMLIWVFGNVNNVEITEYSSTRVIGKLCMEFADVNWYLSINPSDLNLFQKFTQHGAYRSLKIDDKVVELSNGFKDLHEKSYELILERNGFGIEIVQSAIKVIHDIRKYEFK